LPAVMTLAAISSAPISPAGPSWPRTAVFNLTADSRVRLAPEHPPGCQAQL
jgi:hypothetical protein